MNKSFENQWKDAFYNASEPPSPEMWDKIEAALDKQDRKASWLIWRSPKLGMGIAAGIALVMGSVFYFNHTHTPDQMHTVATVQEQVSARNEMLEKVSDGTSESLQSTAVELLPKTIKKWKKVDQIRELAQQKMVEVQQEEAVRQLQAEALASKSLQANNGLTLAEVKVESQAFAGETKKKKKEKWFSLGAGNSPFNPNFSTPNFQTMALNAAYESEGSLKLYDPPFNMPQYGITTSPTEASNEFKSGGSVSVGLTVGKKIKGNWGIETGLRFTKATATNYTNVYSINKYTGKLNSFANTNIIDKSSGENDVLIGHEGALKYEYNFVSVPVLANYDIALVEKLKAQVIAGISNEFLISSVVRTAQNKKESFTPNNSNYKRYNLAGVAGVRLSYPINQHLDVNVGTTYQHFVTSGIEHSSGAVFKPSMWGMNFGIALKK